MYNSHDLAISIKNEAKRKKIQVKEMLEECGLGSNTMSAMYHGKSIAFDSLAKIADYLECSIDFLLGRKEAENTKQIELTEKEQELLDVFRELNDIGQECIIHDARRTREDVKYQKYTDIPKDA